MSWSASAAFCSSLMSEGVWPDILKRDLTRNLEKQAKGKDQKKSELLVTHKHALKKKKKRIHRDILSLFGNMRHLRERDLFK